jgi:hypothetical protein
VTTFHSFDKRPHALPGWSCPLPDKPGAFRRSSSVRDVSSVGNDGPSVCSKRSRADGRRPMPSMWGVGDLVVEGRYGGKYCIVLRGFNIASILSSGWSGECTFFPPHGVMKPRIASRKTHRSCIYLAFESAFGENRKKTEGSCCKTWLFKWSVVSFVSLQYLSFRVVTLL